MLVLKSKEEIERIREGGRIVAMCFMVLEKIIKPGITTDELNRVAHLEIIKKGGVPAFLGYRGFPKSICVSIDEEVIHGVPGQRYLKEGDLLKIDIGVLYKGYYADAARTFLIGEVSEKKRLLKNISEEAFKLGFSKCKKGGSIRDISSVIQKYVESFGFSVVREFGGHGIGKNLHEEPQVPNFVDGKNIKIEEGMVFCIEPMVNEGTWEVKVLSDGWTVVTKDGELSAHFEETVAITENGPEILTRL